jgi:hypothetical protein
MPYQFIHLDVFARAAAAKAKEKGWSLREVIGEARREPTHCLHVHQPRQPVTLFGSPLSDVEQEANLSADGARDSIGRKLRRDAPILLVGVASHPTRPDAVGVERAAYDEWERDTVKWLKSKYGARLRNISRHEDEGWLHLHFFVLPELVDGERIETVHPGRAAVANGRAAGIVDRKALDLRYRQAMRDFQEEFYLAVGARHGLARRGPGRRRLTRGEWQIEQESTRRTAHLITTADAEIERTFELEDRLSDTVADLVGTEGLLVWTQNQRDYAEQRASDLSKSLDASRRAAVRIASEARSLLQGLVDFSISASERPRWIGAGIWDQLNDLVRRAAHPRGKSLTRLASLRDRER